MSVVPDMGPDMGVGLAKRGTSLPCPIELRAAHDCPFVRDADRAGTAGRRSRRRGGARTRSEPIVSARGRQRHVIDDEEGICKFVTFALANLGLKAESYHTAPDAIAALERGHPEIVFLDIALKGSDAIDVLRALGDRRYSGVVQVMSGSGCRAFDDVRRIGARHGLVMRTPLQKPFRMDAVRQAISSAHFDGQPETTMVVSPTIKLDLAGLLAKQWLELWYQPKVDLRTGMLVGAEGLIRCRHPLHGVVGPDCYLPSASKASLAALTEYVVLAALRDWNEIAGAGAHLRVAVNANLGR